MIPRQLTTRHTTLLHLDNRKDDQNLEVPPGQLEAFLDGFHWYECATLEPGSPVSCLSQPPHQTRGRRHNARWTARNADDQKGTT